MLNATGAALRPIRRQRLFFRFALGPHGQLKREPRRLLSGHVFDRFVLARFVRRSGRAALQRKDDLANFDLLPFFDLDLAHDAADEEGTSITALSVSSSITGWPSAMLAIRA
jgi:hypothetical protein